MSQGSFAGPYFFPRRFRRHVYLRDQSIEVMRDILQSRYLHSNGAHKQLARTSLSADGNNFNVNNLRSFAVLLCYFCTSAMPVQSSTSGTNYN